MWVVMGSKESTLPGLNKTGGLLATLDVYVWRFLCIYSEMALIFILTVVAVLFWLRRWLCKIMCEKTLYYHPLSCSY